jgi:hypothetical protein
MRREEKERYVGAFLKNTSGGMPSKHNESKGTSRRPSRTPVSSFYYWGLFKEKDERKDLKRMSYWKGEEIDLTVRWTRTAKKILSPQPCFFPTTVLVHRSVERERKRDTVERHHSVFFC